MSRLLAERLSDIVVPALAGHIIPGCVVGAVDASGLTSMHPFGHLADPRDSAPVVVDTVYDAASLTKALPVSSLALQALEQGLFTLDTLLADIVPEYRSPAAGETTIRHLLTHTLDFDFRLSSMKDLPAADILAAILTVPLKHPPGSTFFYSNATSILLGMAVEKVFGSDLATLAAGHFFAPLAMHDTCFRPPFSMQHRIAPTEIDDWRGGPVRGVVHDESAFVLQSIMTPGSAGLFTTVPDLLKFLQMILAGGSSGTRRFFTAATVAAMAENQIAPLGLSAGMGFELNQRRYMGSVASQHTIGKTGFTGCVVMADLQRGRALALLTNYTWPRRKAGAEQINLLRSAIADAVFESDW